VSDVPALGPALVLVPGLSCDAALWDAQVAGLADVARMTVADTLSDDSIPAMATRLLDTAPERFAIAGLSMGGYVAMEVIRRAPERVTALACSTPTPAPIPPTRPACAASPSAPRTIAGWRR
jgi:pimeloyl-ACP methyl ester carboxylesterase